MKRTSVTKIPHQRLLSISKSLGEIQQTWSLSCALQSSGVGSETDLAAEISSVKPTKRHTVKYAKEGISYYRGSENSRWFLNYYIRRWQYRD